ncbi:Hypothetical protein ABZS17I87_00166 [Kosakonia cowanii]
MSQVTENKVVSAPVPMTPLQEFWHYFKRNKGAVVGLAYVVVMLIIAIFANFIAPHNPADLSSAMRCWHRIERGATQIDNQLLLASSGNL